MKTLLHLMFAVVSTMASGESDLTKKQISRSTLHHLTKPTLRELPKHLYGITTDNGYDDNDLPDSLRALSKKTITRIVYDSFVPAESYLPGTSAVYEVSYVMGELVDSASMSSYSVKSYRDRTYEYWDTLHSMVDVWEIGNEVNGDWTGSIESVAIKIHDAFNIVNGHGGRTALTLHYSGSCATSSEHDMFNWAKSNITNSMKHGLDFVFVSYYEDECFGRTPDWNDVFAKLVEIFPNSRVGIGEFGTKNSEKKKTLLTNYYSLSRPGAITVPQFVGGYFYWYYYQDMVPKTKPLWKHLNRTLMTLP